MKEDLNLCCLKRSRNFYCWKRQVRVTMRTTSEGVLELKEIADVRN